ncbi:DUF2784 domain-containing protein [Aestuariirhabdus sp. Z084]|uniref:DUF2784 domain-containing protein n=1 Tax=Aestuariirhabdus haliotis TaxID=2918751 RepID=UPI00201B37AA|nr:DUF2784 domain-containing protein [Aestuariirhabdus haliotis]MCL6417778.1 DUF2784 domain-containing protein [Aestuariirhabdus haliotis]MCL6421709.1 DUF2784 domain-containing protein [Aestuariirhabdus haliotis]
MDARIIADLLVLTHLLFIIFALLGGLFTLYWRWTPLLHLPAVCWIALLEFNGWICPLTPLENQFRRAAGEAGYPGGFIEHYLIPLIYPAGLTPQWQVWLGVLALLINLSVYLFVLLRLRRA